MKEVTYCARLAEYTGYTAYHVDRPFSSEPRGGDAGQVGGGGARARSSAPSSLGTAAAAAGRDQGQERASEAAAAWWTKAALRREGSSCRAVQPRIGGKLQPAVVHCAVIKGLPPHSVVINCAFSSTVCRTSLACSAWPLCHLWALVPLLWEEGRPSSTDAVRSVSPSAG